MRLKSRATSEIKKSRNNLTDGGYVSKDKYTDLETTLTGKQSELEKANGLIEELKKGAGKDTELQQKISGYEAQVADLQAENKRLKAENALKFALIEAGATDVDPSISESEWYDRIDQESDVDTESTDWETQDDVSSNSEVSANDAILLLRDFLISLPTTT